MEHKSSSPHSQKPATCQNVYVFIDYRLASKQFYPENATVSMLQNYKLHIYRLRKQQTYKVN